MSQLRIILPLDHANPLLLLPAELHFDMPSRDKLLWVNKTAQSHSLSHSDQLERIQVFSHAQRISRLDKRQKPIPTSQKGDPTRLARIAHNRCYLCHGTCSVKPTLTLTPAWTTEERRSVTFFFEVTVHKMISPQQESDFWLEILPCLAMHHAAFKHLIVAIASTHELIFHTDVEALHIFALTQCSQATKLLRASHDWKPALYLVSCVLVAAYSLLRTEFTQAHETIESGLKIPLPETASVAVVGRLEDVGTTARQILLRLSRCHGFKFWTPDISIQFANTRAGDPYLDLETSFTRGPFVDVAQVFTTYTNITVGLVAKILRNLARGAYVDPLCPFAQDTTQQLAVFSFYWDMLYHQVPLENIDQRLELKQLRIGFNRTQVIFFSRIISPMEKPFDAYPSICDYTLALAREVLLGLQNGRRVEHMDKLVNGSLFTFGLCSYCSLYRQRIVAILQSQSGHKDGLVNWLRGTIINIIAKVENDVLGEGYAQTVLSSTKVILSAMRCSVTDRMIRVECTIATRNEETLYAADYPVDWVSTFGPRLSTGAVNDCLQGIMTTYRMYGKPRASDAPYGYLRDMRYRGRPVRVCWGPGWSPSQNLKGDGTSSSG
jgi:hypothetical protein